MPTDRTLRLAAAAEPSGSSFDEELRHFVFRRCRAVLWITLGIIAFAFIDFVVGAEPLVPQLGPWRFPFRLGHLASVLIGLVLLNLKRDSLRWCWAIVLVVLFFNLALGVVTIALNDPGGEPFFVAALILFIHAAIIPNRSTQIWLAILTVLTVFTCFMLSYGLAPDAELYWADLGNRVGATQHAVQVTINTALLAAISVIVSWNLYRLQKTAHEAERLGNYFVERELGAGGMGKVYVARHRMIRRPTAVKVLLPGEGDRQSALARFEREVQLSASLSHPNTITIYDFGRTADDTFYYAMEYLEGADLDRLVRRCGPLPPARAVHLLLQTCGSLAEAHDRGIVHRDLKPSNIFVTSVGGIDDFVKVLDFGLARELEVPPEQEVTATGAVMGTPRYIAPEALLGEGAVDPRSDIYSLGGVIYWLLTGRALFEGSSGMQLFADHLQNVPARPSEVSEVSIPFDLDDLVMRCLEKEPARRFPSATQLGDALRAADVPDVWDASLAREWWDLHRTGMSDEAPA